MDPASSSYRLECFFPFDGNNFLQQIQSGTSFRSLRT